MKKKSFIALALAMIMLLTACGGSSKKTQDKEDTQTGEKVEEKIFYLSDVMKDSGDRIPYVWQNGDGLVPYFLYRTLLMADAKHETTKPDLAKEVKVSEDGLEYEFTLEEDAKWSDGESITVDDVKFSVETALKVSMINGIFPSNFEKIEGAEDFRDDKEDSLKGITTDGNKITFKLISPVGTFEQIMGQFYILPKHVLESENPLELHNSDFWTKPVTSGMYKVGEINAGNFIEYVKNENYNKEVPKFDKVVLSYISEPVLALQDNKSYFYSTNKPEEIVQLDEMGSLTKNPIDILFYRYFIANLSGIEGKGDSKIADPRVRQAILHAINREELSNSIFEGISSVNHTGVPTDLEAFWKEADTFEYNPEKAKALLKEANYDDSKPLILAYYYEDQASQDFMQAVSYQLKEVGIPNELTHIQTDSTGALFNIRKYDLGYKGLSSFGYESWYGEYTSDNTNFRNIYNADESFDELAKQLMEESDLSKRNDLLKELQKLEQEKLFKLNLFTMKNFIYVNTDKVSLPEGLEFGNPFYKFDYRFEEWDIK